MTSEKNTTHSSSLLRRLLGTMASLLFSFSILAVSANAWAKSETNSKIKENEKRISRKLKAGVRTIKKECGIKKVTLDYKLIDKFPLAKKMEEMGRVEGIVSGIIDSFVSLCGDSDVKSRLGLYKSFHMTFANGGTWRVKANSSKITVTIGIKQPNFSGVGKMLKKKI